MRVYKCDRCGKYVAIETKHFFVRKPTPLWRFGRKIHICDDCAKSFRRWFNDTKAKEAPHAERRD